MDYRKKKEKKSFKRATIYMDDEAIKNTEVIRDHFGETVDTFNMSQLVGYLIKNYVEQISNTKGEGQ